MRIKNLLISIIILCFTIITNAQENSRTFQNQHYEKINNQWKVLNTSDSIYYPIQNNVVTIKFVVNTSQETINSFASQNNLTFKRKAITGWCDFQINETSIEVFDKCTTIKTVNANIIDKLEIPTQGLYNTSPNDPSYSAQWHLNRINASGAWNITTGNSTVKVAVIDSGTDWTHNDLGLGNDTYQNIYLNSGEDAWSNPNNPSTGNGIDDDGNGLIDDWKGWNFDLNTNDSRSSTNHGTAVAGIIGAKTDNNLGVAGVAGGLNNEGVKILPIGIGANIPNSSTLDDAILYAGAMGCKVINLSLSTAYSQEINDAIEYTYNVYGAIIVASSGNSGVDNTSFPSNHPLVISVGATTQDDNRSGSNYGENLFISAPGRNILTTTLNNSYINFDKTSASAPIVSGVIALMYSVNPCLTQEQVKNILKDTAEKVGGYNYQWNPNNLGHSLELGYGRVNAFLALQAAQGLNPYVLDLYIKDSTDDVGDEPNNNTQIMWTSDNIWVRNSNDNGLIHQNPEYSSNGIPNYVKVRIINKSCIPSTGNEKVQLSWAKAATDLFWPYHWNGSYVIANTPFGGVVDTLNIPVLQPGEETIVTFNWPVPNPYDFTTINTEPWHFCLLSRIIATNDPMTFTESVNLVDNTRNNNNIAWKNITVVDVSPDTIGDQNNNIGGLIAVGNPFDHPKVFNLEMIKEDTETGKAIFEEAEVGIKMDDILFGAWVRGGKQSHLLGETQDEKRKIIKGNNIILKNISFEANERGKLYLSFNFLTKELTEKSNFRYHVIQKEALTGKIIGGETFEIKKSSRSLFLANASDLEVDLHEPITISAQDINEPAIYNWYDNQGVLIFQGKDLQIASAIAENYKLEVISTTDGFKDYKEVEVSLKPSILESITPNPSSNNATINYKINGANSAYLMVIGLFGNNGTSNNYILDVNCRAINLNISNYLNGLYTVALIVDGEIVDAKTLIKQ
jgi:serine protease